MPDDVVTVTFTVPAGPAGLVALMEVDELTVNPVAGDVPKATAVTPVKLIPVIVTEVLPAVVPDVGLIEFTTGGAPA